MIKKLFLAALVALAGFSGAKAEAETPLMGKIAVGKKYVWVGTSKGLYQFDKTNGESKMFTHGKNAQVQSLTVVPDDKVAVYFNDPMNFTDRTGIVYFDGEAAVDTLNTIKVGKETYHVQAFAMTYSEGLIYSMGAAFFQQTPDGWISYMDPKLGASSNYYNTAMQYQTEKSRLWFTSVEDWQGIGYFGYHSDADGFVYFTEVGRSRDLYISPDGKVYVAANDGVWVCQDDAVKKLDVDLGENLPCMSVSGSGNMVCFSAMGVLAKSDNGVDFEMFSNPNAEADDYITSVRADGRYIWVAYRKAGLFLFEDGQFKVANSGVESIETETNVIDDAIYDLNGRRLNAPAKGQIYIQGGKKHVQR